MLADLDPTIILLIYSATALEEVTLPQTFQSRREIVVFQLERGPRPDDEALERNRLSLLRSIDTIGALT